MEINSDAALAHASVAFRSYGAALASYLYHDAVTANGHTAVSTRRRRIQSRYSIHS